MGPGREFDDFSLRIDSSIGELLLLLYKSGFYRREQNSHRKITITGCHTTTQKTSMSNYFTFSWREDHHHHHHLAVPSAQIPLTLSRHLSLSFIAFDRFPRILTELLYLGSSLSPCFYSVM